MGSVTIKDIARLAGVSVTTVSRALNDAPGINPETRDRVLALCREQGYRTNLLARSLSSNRTYMLGAILSDIASPFHASLIRRIETHAREQGYQVMLCSGRPGDRDINRLFDFLISQRVDGILLPSANSAAVELLDQFDPQVPCVLLGGCAPEESGVRVNAVSTDNYVGGILAADYLHRLGHREVAYLGFRPGNLTHALRYRGFLSAAEKHGMRVRTVENPTGASTIESGYEMASLLFREHFSQTAVFAAADAVALGVMQAADETGVPIPERLSLLGFDDIEYAALPKIRLTTIAQPAEALARSGVRLIVDLIEGGEQGEYTRKLLTPTLVERSTCRPLPAGGCRNTDERR